jgi:phage terminase large subunit-like protein
VVDLSAYARDVVAFVDRFITKNELGDPFVLTPHQREILSLAFTFGADGRLPWDTIIYSTIKKSGKTTINGAITTWWAFTQEAPNELKLIANDLEQSTSRTFNTIKGLLKHNPELGLSADVKAQVITLSNGTTIQALACDYAGEAGANQGLVSCTELWAYTSESSRRLWEELTPVPTRRNSIRVIDTYAGFEGESDLLFDLYKLAVGKEEHPEGQGERVHSTLPIYANREARIFCYWDHEPRMPWQTAQYYEAQRRSLRPNTYLRLHENRWTTGVSSFITAALWEPCVDDTHRPSINIGRDVFVGVDAGIKHDNAAVVVVRPVGLRLELVAHKIWTPSPDAPIDLEETIERWLWEHARHARLIVCDPYQLHRSITTLKKRGLRIEEYPQTVSNLTAAGQALFDLLNGRNLRIYPDAALKQQALNTVAVESPRGWRIAKEKTTKKIDAIVALAMACRAAMDAPRVQTSATWPTPAPADPDVPRWLQGIDDYEIEEAMRMLGDEFVDRFRSGDLPRQEALEIAGRRRQEVGEMQRRWRR